MAEQLEQEEGALVIRVLPKGEVGDANLPNVTNIEFYMGPEFPEELERLDKY